LKTKRIDPTQRVSSAQLCKSQLQKHTQKTTVTMPEHLEMDFCDVDNVVTSWEKLRRLPDYEIEAGTILFTQ